MSRSRWIASLWIAGSMALYSAQTASSATPSKISTKKLWESTRTTKHNATHAKSSTPDTVKKIESSKSTLKQTANIQKQMNRQLERIARAIKKETLENIAINRVLQKLEQEQRKSETLYRIAQNDIARYGENIKNLNRTIDVTHASYVSLLVDQFTLVAMMKALGSPTVSTVIQQEVYETYKKKNSLLLSKLKAKINGSEMTKKRLTMQQNKIMESISSLKAKREAYQKKKREKRKLLAKLEKQDAEYRKQLRAIMTRQKLLRQTLAQLNIIRKQEIARAKREEEARQRELKRKAAERKRRQQNQTTEYVEKSPDRAIDTTTTAGSKHVKQYGSSYQAKNTAAYRGVRTIPPISHAKVVKRFGSYVDPIYKIKIFNDNVVLKAPYNNAKVKNILNGKVVYIGENSMLGKVVIIEHGRRLHTIYASLNRISPLLKVGSRVKKGVIIGRVKRKLIFQATQNSKYINPLRLIHL